MKVSELIAELVGTMKLDGDREVFMSISDGPQRTSTVSIHASGFAVFLRDDTIHAAMLAAKASIVPDGAHP